MDPLQDYRWHRRAMRGANASLSRRCFAGALICVAIVAGATWIESDLSPLGAAVSHSIQRLGIGFAVAFVIGSVAFWFDSREEPRNRWPLYLALLFALALMGVALYLRWLWG
jgi:peptidoglycan/LPS O-acetylase OafA/YrhL